MPTAGQVQDPVMMQNQIELGDIVMIVNPVVYARRIEYGFYGTDKLGRHYNQAGHFMLTQTMEEAPQIAQAATQRVMTGGTISGAVSSPAGQAPSP